MALVADAVAWPPSQSVISSRHTDAGAEGESCREAFAAERAAARDASEPPAIRTSQAGCDAGAEADALRDTASNKVAQMMRDMAREEQGSE